MRQLISQRDGGGTPRNRPLSMASDTPARGGPGPDRMEDVQRSLTTLVTEADTGLARASTNHETLESGIRQLAEDLQEVGLHSFISSPQLTVCVIVEVGGPRKDAS
jgi:hypothetical protein